MGVYLRVDEHWKPNENTVAYFPFSEDALDVTWNNTLTNNWTQDWLWRKFSSASVINTVSWTVGYINYRLKINTALTGNKWICVSGQKGTGYYPSHNESRMTQKIFVWNDSSYWLWWTVTYLPSYWTWHNLSYWYDWTKTIYSIDWVTWTLYNWEGYHFDNAFLVSEGADVTISNLILETVARTAEEIADYYNYTKSNYWIS